MLLMDLCFRDAHELITVRPLSVELTDYMILHNLYVQMQRC